MLASSPDFLLLPVKGHGGIGGHAGVVDEVAGLDEHAAAAAGRVQQDAALRLQNVHDHFDQGFGREEHPVVRGDVLGKLIEEVFVDAADHVAAHVVHGAVVEDAQQLTQQLVREDGVVLGQHAGELFALLLHQGHGVVDHLAQRIHRVAVTAQKPRRGDIRGQVHQIVVLRLLGQEQGALGGKVAGLHRQDAPAA